GVDLDDTLFVVSTRAGAAPGGRSGYLPKRNSRSRSSATCICSPRATYLRTISTSSPSFGDAIRLLRCGTQWDFLRTPRAKTRMYTFTCEIEKEFLNREFTSAAFTDLLKQHHIAISMHGKGCWRDNVFVERL